MALVNQAPATTIDALMPKPPQPASQSQSRTRSIAPGIDFVTFVFVLSGLRWHLSGLSRAPSFYYEYLPASIFPCSLPGRVFAKVRFFLFICPK